MRVKEKGRKESLTAKERVNAYRKKREQKGMKEREEILLISCRKKERTDREKIKKRLRVECCICESITGRE